MTDKDNKDIIENNESGRKPRRVPKTAPNKDQTFTLEDDFLDIFNNNFLAKTIQRIRKYPDNNEFDLGSLGEKWHSISKFQKEIIPIDKIATSVYVYAENPCFIQIYNGDVWEYYAYKSQHRFGKTVMKLALPKWPLNLLKATNKSIEDKISNLNENLYGFMIIPLDRYNQPKTDRNGFYMPFLSTDSRIQEVITNKARYPLFELEYSEDPSPTCKFLETYSKTTSIIDEIQLRMKKWKDKKND